MDRARLGTWLALTSVVGFLAFVAASAAIAPAQPVTDDAGDILHSAELQQAPGDAKYFDVAHLPNGSVRGTFEDTTVNCSAGPNVTADCSRTGVRILSADLSTIKWEYSWLTYQQWSTEVHDAEYLPERDEMLIADMEAERVFAVDMATKETVWEWRAAQIYQRPTDPKRVDWLHINDVDRVESGLYMVSVRNADQILFVRRACACAVEIVNRDSDERVLNKQHNPQWLGDNRLLVSDSENDRIVELRRTDVGEWQVSWTLYEAGGLALDWPRDADRLANGHTLITDTGNRRIVEVERDGDLVRQISIPGKRHVYDADLNGSEYPAGPAYSGGGILAVTQQPFDSVSVLYGAVRFVAIEAGAPLPPWVNEWHALAGLLSMVGSLSGGALAVVNPRSDRDE